MKALRGIQMFNLDEDGQAKKYYSLLKQIVRKKLKVPIMAKGTVRMIDFTKKLAKLDFYPPFETAWTKQEKFLLGEFLSGQ
jgi:hypothetical protein